MGLDGFFETTYKIFKVEFISHTFYADGQYIKGCNVVFYYACLLELSKTTQKIRFSVKVAIKRFLEHLPSYVPGIAFSMPLPPLPSLLVQGKGSHT